MGNVGPFILGFALSLIICRPRTDRFASFGWWLLFTGFVGTAMVWFTATGFCIMANSLYWLGAEPRLLPDRKPVPAAAISGPPAHV